MSKMTPPGPAASYAAARQQAALFDVSSRGKVELRGPDAVTFLQNLSTNDVKSLAPGDGCELFLTNLHARVLAHGFAYRLKEPALWLGTDPGLNEKVVQHLGRFLISEDVELIDHSAEFAQFHLAGPKAREVLERSLKIDLPDLRDHQHVARTVEPDLLCFVRRRDPLSVPGYDILCPVEQAIGLPELFQIGGAVAADATVYDLLRIEAGTPEYGKDIDETNLAPEVGRTRQAICYTKGCFLGQEPLVRIRDLGHVNRALARLEVAGSERVAAGSKLWRDGKEVGQITSAAVSPLGSVAALAYVRRGANEAGTELEVETMAGKRPARVVG